MLKSFDYRGNLTIYYDIEQQIIARKPTLANLRETGSDNSLYFGMIGNEKACEIFCNLFRVPTINQIKGLHYTMNAGGESVPVVININAEGQIQIKLPKNGIINKLTHYSCLFGMKNIDFTQMLVVVDFGQKEIRFADPQKITL